jgi:hypothetical protein
MTNEMMRVLFDNHHGKTDHMHLDDLESEYEFVSVKQLWEDFYLQIKNSGGTL